MEDARNQLAVLQVVCRQRRFILVKTAIDFIHPIPRVINGFALTEQFAGHRFQGKEEKFQNADFSASMPSIISRPLA